MADDLFVSGSSYQLTTLGVINIDLLSNPAAYQSTSAACIVDLLPPTFAGVVSIDIESRGQIRTTWAAATDPTPPIRYEIYVKASTATGLFNVTNIAGITDKLQFDVFTLADGSYLQNGTTYFVGVRALDGVSNRDANLVSLSVISTGVLTSIDVYEAKAVWSTSHTNMFQVTAWATKNSSRAKAPGDVMGAASYQVFNSTGTAVVGLSGSLGSPNAEGLYIFSAVSSPPLPIHDHYEVRVTVSVDGENRTNFMGLSELPTLYTVGGAADLTYTGDLTGSFWVNDLSGVVTSNLGTASWQLFTSDGTDTGIGNTGLTANADGFFTVVPFTFPGPLDTTFTYLVRVTITVSGQTVTSNVEVAGDPLLFDTRAIFSINGANQLQATFWAIRNEEQAIPAVTLGTASYTVYDSAGVAVAGLSQTGIVADGNGYFHITPVSAALLTDLTHYKARITISVQGQDRSNTHGFTLLGN